MLDRLLLRGMAYPTYGQHVACMQVGLLAEQLHLKAHGMDFGKALSM